MPPGDLKRAAEVRSICRDHGIMLPSYGSYYRLGQPMDEFKKCLDTAQALGAKTVRIWCGTQGSRAVQSQRSLLIDTLLNCALEARLRSLTIAPEYHIRTLTDERESVRRLLQETVEFSDCLNFYWQPRFDRTLCERLDSLCELSDRLGHIHAFSWTGNDGRCRLPLAAEEEMWKTAIALLHKPPFLLKTRCILLEFVQNDSTDALLRDAAALRSWLSL